MENSHWVKADQAKQIKAELDWSRPENRNQAGRLLIVSGNSSEFSVAAQAYQTALSSGAGAVRIILPDNLKKLVPKELQFELYFAPSVAHGSFSQLSLAELLEHSHWASGVLMPGGIGKNSETSLLVEKFVDKYTGLLTIGEDTLDMLIDSSAGIMDRANTVIVADFSQAQKLFIKNIKNTQALTYDLPVERVVELLQEATTGKESVLITKQRTTIYIAHSGKVCTLNNSHDLWRVETASKVAVWAMQHPNQLFNACIVGSFTVS